MLAGQGERSRQEGLQSFERRFTVTRIPPIAGIFLACLTACSSAPEVEPPEPIARFGAAPTIDGAFGPGEWDDAAIVRVGTVEQFRIKHDGVNLYLAVRAGGGDLVFNTDAGVRVLHWSAQLGLALYARSDAATQALAAPFEFELWGLHDESPDAIRDALARYLAENGWVANTASMGELMQSELAVSLNWLGVSAGAERFVELPGFRIAGGLMISRDDPREAELRALSREEIVKRYPSVAWPAQAPPGDSIGTGGELPQTIRPDPEDYGTVWVDLRS